MKKHNAFTMIELIFVIVIMGILGKFGVEFLAQAYNSFIFSKINNELQSQSELAVEMIAKRLEYRITPSTIKRIQSSNYFQSASSNVTNPDDYNILEWIGYDIDGFRGDTKPLWSGILDFDTTLTTVNKLYSPDTNTTAIDNLIKTLSYNTSDISHAALFFNDSDYDLNSSFGWDGAITENNNSGIHRIDKNGTPEEFVPEVGSFVGLNIYRRYYLAWSAYAIVHENNQLIFYYNYQPWEGESYDTDGTSTILMENVSTFRIKPNDKLFNIMVCVKSTLTNQEHAICKEKVIF